MHLRINCGLFRPRENDSGNEGRRTRQKRGARMKLPRFGKRRGNGDKKIGLTALNADVRPGRQDKQNRCDGRGLENDVLGNLICPLLK